MTSAGVERHYARSGLIEAIREGLKASGKELDRLSPADLAAIDEFHIRGRKATLELAAAVRPKPSERVIDIGCGLGGASRVLASEFGCRVSGVDLTPDYCRAAMAMAQWVGLGDKVDYQTGNALGLPFAARSFDIAWTQHASMNIADKPRLYAEAHRVLKPGGRFAIYDILQGPGGPVHFPVPWAREPSISHLVTPEEMRRLLETAGFEILSWRDVTAEGRDWFAEKNRQIRDKAVPPLNFSLLLGPDYRVMAENQERNLREGRIALIEAVGGRR
ncbi:MAG: SAM-dependent methyltransferase [Rhodospirillales bacterium]|jgi:ubiquinone/menaquinone biosynthesis C-methylase UbiE|nr:SAM-dependent methyltransferase [Rhodospirillales bacterium]